MATGAMPQFAHFEKFSLNFSNLFVNLQSVSIFPSLTILVPFWFIYISLVFFHLFKLLFFRFPLM